MAEQANPIEIPPFTPINLVGCVVAIVTLLVTIGCCVHQVKLYCSEKRSISNQNNQVGATDLHSPDDLATDRKPLPEFADDVKPTHRRFESRVPLQTDAGLVNAPETSMRTEEEEDMRNELQKKPKYVKEFTKIRDDKDGAPLEVS
jgi:hypothetical protein